MNSENRIMDAVGIFSKAKAGFRIILSFFEFYFINFTNYAAVVFTQNIVRNIHFTAVEKDAFGVVTV